MILNGDKTPLYTEEKDTNKLKIYLTDKTVTVSELCIDNIENVYVEFKDDEKTKNYKKLFIHIIDTNDNINNILEFFLIRKKFYPNNIRITESMKNENNEIKDVIVDEFSSFTKILSVLSRYDTDGLSQVMICIE